MKEIIIRSDNKWKLIDFPELWRYRELFYIFAWRDIKVRYKQTALGVLWVIFQPLVSTLIFTVFFGRLAKIPSYDMPYSLFVLSGLIFWNYFSSTLTSASSSMVVNEGIIKKVYFPRMILPLASAVTGLVDFTINLIMLFIFAIALGYYPSPWILLVLPLSIIITIMTASGLGFFLSSVNVKYRDVNYIIPFFIQLLLFVSPIIYPLAIVSDTNKTIMAINPMTSVVESIRMVFADRPFIGMHLIIISIFSALCIFVFGLWYFRRTEHSFADIV